MPLFCLPSIWVFVFPFRRKYEKLHFYMLLSLHALPSSSMNILQIAYNDYYLQIM